MEPAVVASVNQAAVEHHLPSPFRAWGTVGLLSLLMLVSFVDRLILALLVEPLKAELNISDTQIGLLIGTTFALMYTVIGLPLARVADGWNRRNLIFLGALIWTATTSASAFANSFVILLALRVGVAVGEAVLSPSAMSMIADMFPRHRRTFPASVFMGIGNCGATISLVLAAVVLNFASTEFARSLPVIGDLSPWRLTLFLVGVPGIMLALFFLATVREPSRGLHANDEAPLSVLWAHLRAEGRTYWGYLGGAALGSLNIVGVMTWYPTFLVRAYDLPAATAGYWFGAAGVFGTIAGTLLIPMAANYLARKGRDDAQFVVACIALAIAMPLLIGSLLASNAVLSVALMTPGFLIIIGVGIMMATVSPLLAPSRLRAQMMAAFSFMTTVCGLGIGPVIVASLADNFFTDDHGLGHALALQVAIVAPCIIVLLFVTRQAFGRSMREAAAAEKAHALAAG